MSDRGRSKWRGDKKSTGERAGKQAILPEWKRQNKSVSTAPGQLAWRRYGKLLLLSSLLMAVVGLGIWYVGFQDKTYTHVVVINPLNEEEDALFDTAAAPDIQEGETWLVSRITKQETRSAQLNDWGEKRNEAHALIIYLQAHILVGPSGTENEFRYLIGNSDPDLEGENSHGQLQDVKKSIQVFQGKHSGIPVVLLVDQLHGLQDWRMGALPTDLNEEFISWTNDLPGLVIVSSCSNSSHGHTGRSGRTAFALAVQKAFSTAADDQVKDPAADGHNKVTVEEFCNFIRDETRRWVRQHRHPDGQNVAVWPKDLSSLEKTLVLRDPLKNPGFPALSENTKSKAETLDDLWELRDELDGRLAWRWNPLLWESSTEFLLRAANTLLDGNLKLAENLQKRATKRLSELNNITAKIVLQPSEGQTLGEKTYIHTAWQVNFDDEPNRPWEVLETNLTTFADKGFLEDKTRQSLSEQLTADRRLAEQAVSQLSSLSSLLRPTIFSEEQQLLFQEDNTFAVPRFVSADLREHWDAIKEFAQEHQQAELLFQDILRRSRTLARWASRSPEKLPEMADDDLKNTDGAPKFEVEKELQNATPDRKLKAAILHLLMSARHLGNSLYPVSDSNDRVLKIVRTKDDCQLSAYRNLKKSRSDADESLKVVKYLISTLADKLAETRTGRSNQVRQYHQIRQLLQIADLTAGQRNQLMDQALKLDQKFDDMAGDNGKKDSGDTEPGSSTAAGPWIQAWWQLQYLSLFLTPGPRGSDSGPLEISRAFKHAVDIVRQADENDPLEQELADFGEEVRTFWQESRKQAKWAGRNKTADLEQILADLWQADLHCRGMSAWDAQELKDVHPTTALHAWWQTDFCRLQIERLKRGQWVLPNDEQRPWHEHGWYRTEADRWRDHARSIARSDRLSKYNDALGEMPDLPKAAWSLDAKLPNDVFVGGAESSQKREVVIQQDGRDIPAGNAVLLTAIDKQGGDQQQFTAVENRIQALEISQPDQVLTAELVFKRVDDRHSDGCHADNWTSLIFYRGRWFNDDKLTVNPCPLPRYIATRLARPDNATVRLTGTDIRPIVFVLDMSGSMTRNVAGGETRKNKALEVMEDVIGNLPAETKVQLTAFGLQKEGGLNGKTNDDFSELGLGEPQDVKAYEDFVPLTDQLEHLGSREDKKSGRSRILAMLDKLKHVDPVGVTPLTYSIARAVTLLPRRGGLVVAITDGLAGDVGLDNRAGSETLGKATSEYQAGEKTKDLEVALQKRPGSKVVVCPFELQDKEQEVLPAFNNALQRFVNPGQITVLQNVTADKLANKIKDALDPRNYTVTRSSRNDPDEAPIGEEIEISNPKPDDDYTIRFGDDDLAPAENVHLSRGDFLTLGVDWRGQQFRFDRWTGSSRAEPLTQPPTETDDAPDTLRSIDATREDAGESDRVRMLLMLDHDHENRPVQQPAEIELFYLSGKEQEPHWRFEERFVSHHGNKPLGAPSYQIDIQDWPRSRSIAVVARWKMQRTCPDAVVTFEEIKDSKFDLHSKNARLPHAVVRPPRVRADGVLGVELAPPEDTPMPENQMSPLWNVRVEVGKDFVVEDKCDFMPLELRTEIQRVEDGSVDVLFYRDNNPFSEQELQKLVFAFTSEASRREAAFECKLQHIDLREVEADD